MKSETKYAQHHHKAMKCMLMATLLVLATDTFASEPWPAESWKKATQLGDLEESFGDGDVSGAHWNNNTKTLWVSDNKEEMIWSLKETDNGFEVETSFEGKGDLEGITQALDDDILYLMDEEGYIRSYDAKTGDSLTKWEIDDELPTDGKSGPEGITFIPDTWLESSGFVDNDGDLYKKSRYDLGGLFLVAHQNGGGLYAFDLASSGAFHFVGEYETEKSESSGLAFDRSTGILYISHNVGDNSLETTNLSSTVNDGHREFVSLAVFEAPNDSNLEGFAIKPAINEDNTLNDVWAFYTDDDGNTSDGNAILVFKDLPATLSVVAGDNQVAEANVSVAINPSVLLKDAFDNKISGVETNFSVTQGGGVITGSTVITGTTGVAQLGSWTLGSDGEQVVTVSVGDISREITASISGDVVTPETPESTTITATASGRDDDNIAANVLDDNPSTRWSASGEQWLQLDLGSTQTITGVAFEFYKGEERSTIFDIITSVDGVNWNEQLETVYSQGNTSEVEHFYFDLAADVRYVRFVGYGNNASSSSTAKWNSIVEMDVLTSQAEENTTATNSAIKSLSVVSVSSDRDEDPATNLFDGKTKDSSDSRWAVKGLKNANQWVVIDLGARYVVSKTVVYPYDERDYQYVIELSDEADANFEVIVDRSDNKKKKDAYSDDVENGISGRYLRLEIQGADDYSGDWASINELEVEGHKE